MSCFEPKIGVKWPIWPDRTSLEYFIIFTFVWLSYPPSTFKIFAKDTSQKMLGGYQDTQLHFAGTTM